jgi:hypothetical protein
MQWVSGAFFLGLKRPGCVADDSLSLSAEAKNGAATPPLPHTPSWRGA